ncbi:MAG: RnfABCDGE type electron transport complex subunit B [bacterium]
MIEAIIAIGGLGAVSGLGLGFAAKKFAVFVDPKIEEIEDVLPAVNCGACGYAGCAQFAKAVVEEGAEVNGCIPGGHDVAKAVAAIMGMEAQAKEKVIARVLCQGSPDCAVDKYEYIGVEDCLAVNLVAGGDKLCQYGCLGHGSCVKVCPFDAIHMGDNRLPVVDMDKCTGCGKCEQICPKNVIEVTPPTTKTVVLCNSVDKGAVVRKSCKVGCIGCMMCQKVCEDDAITIDSFLAKINQEKCTTCLKCVEKCPTKCIAHHNTPF